MEDLTQLAYSVDTLYFLLMGVLVMFMAPGFAMLEAGMVRAKNTVKRTRFSAQTCRWRRSACSSSGSAGLASTAVVGYTSPVPVTAPA